MYGMWSRRTGESLVLFHQAKLDNGGNEYYKCLRIELALLR